MTDGYNAKDDGEAVKLIFDRDALVRIENDGRIRIDFAQRVESLFNFAKGRVIFAVNRVLNPRRRIGVDLDDDIFKVAFFLGTLALLSGPLRGELRGEILFGLVEA